MRNRRVVITRKGGPEALALVEDDLPDPGPGEVQVRVLASGVAFGDVLKRRGLVPGMPPHPYTPGYDLVGMVEKVGAGVHRLEEGDRVAALVMNGANAERANVAADLPVVVPPGPGDAEALCLVLNYVTAWQMLHRVAAVRHGQRVLVHGAAGGVGQALLQLARLEGATAYGTASKAKHGIIERLGATPIDYRSEDFVVRVRGLSGGGVDAAFDAVGGSHLFRSWRAVRPGGMLVSYGVSSGLAGGMREILLTFLLAGLLKLRPFGPRVRFYGILTSDCSTAETIRADLAALLALLADGRLEPLVAARLPLAEAAKAHDLVENARVAGKVVLVPG
jgi:NADPH:quinone reductase-like Zn-dependent oxidoreductase